MFEIVERVIDKFSVFKEKIIPPKPNPYPCQECILFQTCSELCDKVEQDTKKIFEKMFDGECCPDCGGKRIIEGPCGGCSQNVFCASCDHGFNLMGPMRRAERIGMNR